MSLVRTAALAATVLSQLCSAASAAGPYRPFQIGLWLGGAYTDDRTGTFAHCSAGVVYDGGINLFVVRTEAHGWWLGFTSAHWSLTPSASIPVNLQFMGDRRWRYSALSPMVSCCSFPHPMSLI
jgi:hypothetical protein